MDYSFLEARDDDKKPLSMPYIKAEALPVLLAGADNTGTAFQVLIVYILNKLSTYGKLIADIDSGTRAGHLSPPVPSYNEVTHHLPQYNACIHETMRLCPSAPNIFSCLVSSLGMKLASKFVPEGIEITCNPYLVHRDQSHLRC